MALYSLLKTLCLKVRKNRRSSGKWKRIINPRIVRDISHINEPCGAHISLSKSRFTCKLTMAMFEQKRRLAGVICLVSDMDKDGIDMFDMYKGREDVELAFDTMKNRLESDKTYLRSDEAVRWYFLATFLAMRIYFKILKSLREKGLTNKISVEEVLFELSKVTKIVEKIGREYFAKIPKRARRMCSLFPEVLPMG